MTDRPIETKVQSFIVKIWVEETVGKRGEAIWRGHITHVTSGKRRYVKSLKEITNYFRLHLKSIDVDL